MTQSTIWPKARWHTCIKGDHEVLGDVYWAASWWALTYRGPFDDLPAVQGVVHRVIPDPEVSET